MKLNECVNNNDLYEYLKEKGSNHINYKKYSSHITDTFGQGFIILSDGCNWDDQIDCNNINKCKSKLFITCFCCQIEENYTMWKAYGGDKPQLLNINKKQINKIINEAHNIELFKCNGERAILNRNDYDIYLIDVVYRSTKNKKNKINYVHQNEYEHQAMRNIDPNQFYIKEYTHYDERECRLVIEIKNKQKYQDFRKAKLYFDKDIINNDCIICSFDNKKHRKSRIYSNIKETCASKCLI